MPTRRKKKKKNIIITNIKSIHTRTSALRFLMAAAKLPLLASIWFAVVAPVVLVDGIFVLKRQPVGAADLTHPLAETFPFNYWLIYEKYDRRYAPNDDAFVVAQSYMNMIEVVLGLVTLALSLVGEHSCSIKLAFTVALMTFYKTVLYFLMDVVEGGIYTHHNTQQEQFLYVILPSSFWILIPGIIMKMCWNRMQCSVEGANGTPAAKKKK
ncbi:hypothetical protein STCU_07136 [Strigomonas culicis]|uniref:EXPERA domain-containing protein n=1 Tax=Strigomonas culicis TaxID=28005 RepID=S9VBY8_9TRYP|nr:hypothetical protein STCU_07136 [Strigomonas culicis]|eukprot:EPY24526.1 hypothetical protein STCU_07136 [Strigomonas culicis]